MAVVARTRWQDERSDGASHDHVLRVADLVTPSVDLHGEAWFIDALAHPWVPGARRGLSCGQAQCGAVPARLGWNWNTAPQVGQVPYVLDLCEISRTMTVWAS